MFSKTGKQVTPRCLLVVWGAPLAAFYSYYKHFLFTGLSFIEKL